MLPTDVTPTLPAENGDKPKGLPPLPKPKTTPTTSYDPKEMLDRIEQRIERVNASLYGQYLDLSLVGDRLRPTHWTSDDPPDMKHFNDWLKVMTTLGLYGHRIVRAFRDQRTLYQIKADKDAPPAWIDQALDELREELGWDV